MRTAGLLIVLIVVQSVSADYYDENCYVSGALMYGGRQINGRYSPMHALNNGYYTWSRYDQLYGEGYELVVKNVSDPVNHKHYNGWTISISYNYGWVDQSVLAKNTWEYTYQPDDSAGDWYQYDSTTKTYFHNTQLRIDCRDDLSGGEIAGIVIGSVCAALLLGGLVFFTCRHCKNNRPNKKQRATTSAAAVTRPTTSPTPHRFEFNDLYDGKTTGGTAEAPPAYSNAVVEDEEKIPVN